MCALQIIIIIITDMYINNNETSTVSVGKERNGGHCVH